MAERSYPGFKVGNTENADTREKGVSDVREKFLKKYCSKCRFLGLDYACDSRICTQIFPKGINCFSSSSSTVLKFLLPLHVSRTCYCKYH